MTDGSEFFAVLAVIAAIGGRLPLAVLGVAAASLLRFLA